MDVLHMARVIVVMAVIMAAYYLFGWLAGIGWWAMAAGIAILAIIVGLAHLGGRIESALRKGGTGQRPEV